MIQHFFRPRLTTALNAHRASSSPGGLCARTHTNETFSYWCGDKSFTVGRARCGNVCRHMAGPWLKKKQNQQPRHTRNGFLFFEFYRTKPNSTSTRRQTVPVHSNVRAMPPKICCRWCCQVHPPTGEGTERQEKTCCRCCTSVVVMEPATRSSVEHT